MTRARRKEGPWAPLFYSAAAFLLLSGKITTAQTVELSALELCAGLETQELVLACFEAIIVAGRAPAAQLSERAVVVASENAQISVDPEPRAARVAATSGTTDVNLRAPSADDNGRQPLALPDQEEKTKIIEAVVVGVKKSYNRTLYFHLANGHVWRQTEPRHFQYPKRGAFDVNISQGVMGDYRLRIGEKGRMVRVRRVQ